MHPLVSRIQRREKRAVARALTMIENNHPEKRELLSHLYPFLGRAHVVGFTGSPGAGKSTLVDHVIRHLRNLGKTVGVLAVDPSSPFTGGALLGDRVRMTEHSSDPGVYIRSVGSRGNLGGIGAASREMLYALEAYGCDIILLETVGVGQSELDILTVADTVALVLTPGAGDHVQTAKAGIMEIADVFVVNKCDLPGADTLVREVQLMLHDKKQFRESWKPPIVRTKASLGEGIEATLDAMDAHRTHLRESGYWEVRRQARLRDEALSISLRTIRHKLETYLDSEAFWETLAEAHAAHQDPYAVADEILRKIPSLWE